MNEKTQKDVLADLQASFDALPPGADSVPPATEKSPEGTIIYCLVCGGFYAHANEQIDRRGRGALINVQLQDDDRRPLGRDDGVRFRRDLNHFAWLVRYS